MKWFCTARRPEFTVHLLAWLLLVFSALACTILCDVFQSYIPEFPVLPMLCTVTLFHLAALAVYTRIAMRGVPHLKLFQPFIGGDSYVVQQTVGYTATSIALLVLVVYYRLVLSCHSQGQCDFPPIRVPSTLHHFDVYDIHYGLITIAGVLLVVGHGMLLASLDAFQTFSEEENDQMDTPMPLGTVPHKKRKGRERSSGYIAFFAKYPHRESFFVVVCVLTNTVICIVRLHTPGLASELNALYLLFHLGAAFITLIVMGYWQTEHFSFFLPPKVALHAAWTPRCRYILTMGTMWSLFVLALLGNFWFLTVFPAHHVPATVQIALWSVGMVSEISMLLLTRTTDFSLPLKTDNTSPSGIPPSVFTLSMLCAGLSMLMATVSCWLSWRLPRSLGEELERFFPGISPQTLELHAVDGIVTTMRVTTIFLLLCPVASHILGCRWNQIDIWQPFCGASAFVVLQALGWCFFSCSIVAAVISMTDVRFMPAFAACLPLAQLTLQFSFIAQHRNRELADLRRQLVSTIRRHITGRDGDPTVIGEALSSKIPETPDEAHVRAGHQGPATSPTSMSPFTLPAVSELTSTPCLLETATSGPLLHSLFNGEMVMSLLLQVVSSIILILLDFVQLHDETPFMVMRTFAILLTVVATPLAHFSQRDKGIRFFQPFEGSPEFIALQAVGWTLYALMLMGSLISAVDDLLPMAPMGPLAPGDSFSAMEGVAVCLPFTLVSLSMFFEINHEKLMVRSPHERQIPLPRAEPRRRWGESRRGHRLPTPADRAELQRLLASGAVQSVWLRGRLQRWAHASKHPRGPYTTPCRGTSAQPAAAAADKLRETLPHSISSLAASSGPAPDVTPMAAVITILMCTASAALFSMASFASIMSNRRATALVLAHAGMLSTTATLLGLHGLLGPLRWGKAYRFFMAFRGGSTFIILQAAAWGLFTLTLLMVVLFTLDLATALAPLMLAAMTSVAAQLLLLVSLRTFTVRPKPSLLEVHAEAIVGITVLLASMIFTSLFQTVAGGNVVTSTTTVLVAVLAVCLFVPLMLMSLLKSRRIWMEDHAGGQEKGYDLMGYDDFSVDGRERPPFLSFEYALMGTLFIVPVTLIYLLYFVIHNYTANVVSLFNLLKYLLLFTCGLISTVLLSRTASSLFPSWLLDLRSMVMTGILYSMPAFIVGPSYVLPLLIQTKGTVAWAALITMFTIIIPPWNRILLTPCCFALLGYFLFVHAQTLSTIDRYWDYPWLVNGSDLLITFFWTWYSFTYRRPLEMTGERLSPRFVAWMRVAFYEEAARYFHLRIHASRKIRGKLNDPKNQFLFSFHPHGVFPATAMYQTDTDAWRRALGSNSETMTTCHAASIVFNGPLLRDFVMACGARVVTRKGIEHSLQSGNSVMIVTGGQAELLLCKYSTEEMHLVTHHIGFVRLAVKNRVPLVPVLSFAEHNILDNVHWYNIQKLCLKYLGFPFPLVPHGLFHMPWPNRTHVTVVVGEPLPIPENLKPEDEAGIQAFATQFFQELTRIFYKFRKRAGYPNMRLFLHNGVPKRGNPLDPNSEEYQEAYANAEEYNAEDSEQEEEDAAERLASFSTSTG